MVDDVHYRSMKARLIIDTLRLTEELTELPQMQQEAAEFAAEAQRQRDEAKDLLEQIKAEAAANIRLMDVDARKPRSETQISSEILLDDTVREAVASLRNCEYDLSLWKSVADGLRSKSAAIKVISDLIAAGYTSPQSIYSDRRTRPRERS